MNGNVTAARSGEWAQHFSNACLIVLFFCNKVSSFIRSFFHTICGQPQLTRQIVTNSCPMLANKWSSLTGLPVATRIASNAEMARYASRISDISDGPQVVPFDLPNAIFLARDVIYTSRAYATMSVSVSVHLSICLSVTEVHWRIIANLGFKFRSQFTAHCGGGACGREGRDHRREEWRDHLC